MYWARREKQGATHALREVCHDGKHRAICAKQDGESAENLFPQAPGVERMRLTGNQRRLPRACAQHGLRGAMGLRRREQYIRVPVLFPTHVDYARP
jgi:hypothetical protein